MNSRILLLAISVAAFSSCASVYKSGQTPDDVYFSPARPQAESYVEVKKEKEGSNYQTYDQYMDSRRDDRFLRMSVGNQAYMNAYNSYSAFDWRYNSYYDGFNYGYSSPWNNYFAWNNYYNPYSSPFYYTNSYYGGYGGGGYYGGGYGGGIKSTAYSQPISRPLTFNVNNYSNSNRPVSRNYSGNSSYYNTGGQRYNNNNSNSNNRSYYNTNNNNNSNSSSNHPTYTPSNSTPSNSTYTPSRSYSPAPSSSGSSSSGSSSGSSGGGGVSRPGRGN